MAANSLIHAAPGWAQGELLTPTQAAALDVQAAQSINRNSTVSGTRYFQIRPIAQYDNGTELFNCYNDNTLKLTHVGGGGGAPILHIPLDGLLHKQTLTAVRLRLLPAGSHVGQPTLPTFTVCRCAADGSVTNLATATYSWVDIATYEAGFDLVASGMTEIVDASLFSYQIIYMSEWGANSKTGMQLLSHNVTMSIDHAYGGTDLSLWI